MFNASDRVIFSATDLINYLGCQHATFLDLEHLGQPEPSVEPDPTEELLKRKGIEHEQRYLAFLKSQGREVVEVDPKATISQRVDQTRAAMNAGVEVIYQAALLDVPWLGHADFLMRVDGRRQFGTHQYEVTDTKLARTAQPKHLIQLCVYSPFLGLVQRHLPT